MNEDGVILNPDGKTPWNPDEDRLIVCAPDGRPWHPESLTPRFTSAAKMAGFPSVHFHMLRHSAISIRIAAGVHPKVVQEFAGHFSASFKMDQYDHVGDTLQEDAADRVNDRYIGRAQGAATAAE